MMIQHHLKESTNNFVINQQLVYISSYSPDIERQQCKGSLLYSLDHLSIH
ncbi:hypothetical protein LguiA_001966 [Lonicera macranthoides]